LIKRATAIIQYFGVDDELVAEDGEVSAHSPAVMGVRALAERMRLSQYPISLPDIMVMLLIQIAKFQLSFIFGSPFSCRKNLRHSQICIRGLVERLAL
jgi:hypothetical protein